MIEAHGAAGERARHLRRDDDGAVSVLDTRGPRPRTIAEAHRAYWFYARHQSAWMDIDILLRALWAEPADGPTASDGG